ncbi:RNA polymerase sigma factor [Candidatus Formimonas warabiya]|nr:sigma-70 family RNA polymerase sigma factor [Candidatus Formimonas warabiya]
MQNEFLMLYDQFFDDVYRYTLFKTGNKWDADDLVSEVFRKAFEKFTSLRDNPKAWLMTIARNTVIDFYRKKRDLVVEDTELEKHTYTFSFEEALEKQDELRCLKKGLKNLAKEDLELINLKYFADLTHQEIGTIMGKTGDAIKMKTLRIVRQLGEAVKRCMEGK